MLISYIFRIYRLTIEIFKNCFIAPLISLFNPCLMNVFYSIINLIYHHPIYCKLFTYFQFKIKSLLFCF